MRVLLRPSPTGDRSWFTCLPLAGASPTPGALALFYPEVGKALLFPHERPWHPETMDAAGPEELAEKARQLDPPQALLNSSPIESFPASGKLVVNICNCGNCEFN